MSRPATESFASGEANSYASRRDAIWGMLYGKSLHPQRLINLSWKTVGEAVRRRCWAYSRSSAGLNTHIGAAT
jgi:hypothetical protein